MHGCPTGRNLYPRRMKRIDLLGADQIPLAGPLKEDAGLGRHGHPTGSLHLMRRRQFGQNDLKHQKQKQHEG